MHIGGNHSRGDGGGEDGEGEGEREGRVVVVEKGGDMDGVRLRRRRCVGGETGNRRV